MIDFSALYLTAPTATSLLTLVVGIALGIFVSFIANRLISQDPVKPGAQATFTPQHGCLASPRETQSLQPARRLPESIATTSALFLRERTAPYLEERGLFGFDIGGSLAKICVYEPQGDLTESNGNKIAFLLSGLTYGDSGVRDMSLSFKWHSGRFHFIHFETRRMDQAVGLFQKHNLFEPHEPFLATGGGAFKYGQILKEKLGVEVSRADELHCLLRGLNFLLEHVPDECYYLSRPDVLDPSTQDHVPLNLMNQSDVYPYLLANIGSGVSFLRVDGPTAWERVSGTCLGGGTYWGLCRLLAEREDSNPITYARAFELASQGDPSKVNMTVSDIYGGGYKNFGLPGDLTAAAFGKMVMKENPRTNVETGDIARALLDMIAMNVAQVAYLAAVNDGIKRIIFAGSFLRENRLSAMSISFSINYWSKGQIRACFLKHEGYCGSLGVFLSPEQELDEMHKE